MALQPKCWPKDPVKVHYTAVNAGKQCNKYRLSRVTWKGTIKSRTVLWHNSKPFKSTQTYRLHIITILFFQFVESELWMHKTFKHLNVLQETTIIPFSSSSEACWSLSLYYSKNNSIQIFWQWDTVRFFSSFSCSWLLYRITCNTRSAKPAFNDVLSVIC